MKYILSWSLRPLPLTHHSCVSTRNYFFGVVSYRFWWLLVCLYMYLCFLVFAGRRPSSPPEVSASYFHEHSLEIPLWGRCPPTVSRLIIPTVFVAPSTFRANETEKIVCNVCAFLFLHFGFPNLLFSVRRSGGRGRNAL